MWYIPADCQSILVAFPLLIFCKDTNIAQKKVQYLEKVHKKKCNSYIGGLFGWDCELNFIPFSLHEFAKSMLSL